MAQINPINQVILITVDVEDWFQVENFKKCIPFSSWSSRDLRVERNTHRLLDLFDSIKLNKPIQKSDSNHELSAMSHVLGRPGDLHATFFVLGWIAERLPHLVLEIHSRGHEVASHGYYHNLCRQSSYDDLKRDLSDSKKLLEDIVGDPVPGYRAPGFSINDDILKIIEDSGYLYDSSYNSFGMNKRYGQPTLSGNGRKGIAFQLSEAFYELPISNVNLGKRTIPWGGGGYFRLTPFRLFSLGVHSILKKEKAYLFYMHPWEVDPEQPRLNKASSFYKLRHYVNLKRTHSKLSEFLETFSHCGFFTCHQYLEKVGVEKHGKAML
jgi:polysaccharide deacetylase family protein (PEP-CTERM system associated)